MKTLLITLSLMILMIVGISAQRAQENIPKDGFVPNKETAVKVAEAIWLPIYGNEIYNYRPFSVTLKRGNIWVVEGTLKSGKGGVPYIELQKNDCKVLVVTHGK